MKLVVFSAFPRVDRQPYKVAILDGLAAPGSGVTDVALVYAFSGLDQMVRAAGKLYAPADVAQRLLRRGASSGGGAASGASDGVSESGSGDGGGVRGRGVAAAAARHGFTVRRFRRYAESDCLDFLSDFAPDLGLNVGGMYIPGAVLERLPSIVGGHYARLPDIRGSDTIRWTLLLDEPLFVSHQILGPEYDMGDIVRRTPVPIVRTDTVETIRRRCQSAHAEALLALVSEAAAGALRPEPQTREDGSYFRRMGSFLRTEVDHRLAQRRYSHYAD